MTYREDPSLLERRRAELAAAVDRLERGWTQIFWTKITELRDIAPPGAASPARELDAEIARLAARVKVLEALEDEASQFVASWEAPRLVDPVQRTSTYVVYRDLGVGPPVALWLPLPQDVMDFGNRAVAYVRECAGDVPIAVGTSAVGDVYEQPLLTITLFTGCASGLGNFVVRTEGWTGALSKMLGAEDIEIGDPTFDRAFRVSGSETAVSVVLDRDTQSSLLRMAHVGFAAVRVFDGRVRIEQRQLGNEVHDAAWIRDAVAVARAVHRAPPRRLRV